MVGCRKESPLKIPKPIEPVTDFKKLMPENSFNWTNDRVIRFEVIPLTLPIEISNTLSIYSPDKSTVFYKAELEMGKAFKTNITVPANIHELNVRYGTIENTVRITDDHIVFDFVTFDIPVEL